MSFKRHSRILSLHKDAKTGKYNWQELKARAMAMGVCDNTARKYIDEVRERLIKEGLITE